MVLSPNVWWRQDISMKDKRCTFTINSPSIKLHIKLYLRHVSSLMSFGLSSLFTLHCLIVNLMYFRHLIATHGDNAKSFLCTQMSSPHSRFKCLMFIGYRHLTAWETSTLSMLKNKPVWVLLLPFASQWMNAGTECSSLPARMHLIYAQLHSSSILPLALEPCVYFCTLDQITIISCMDQWNRRSLVCFHCSLELLYPNESQSYWLEPLLFASLLEHFLHKKYIIS